MIYHEPDKCEMPYLVVGIFLDSSFSYDPKSLPKRGGAYYAKRMSG